MKRLLFQAFNCIAFLCVFLLILCDLPQDPRNNPDKVTATISVSDISSGIFQGEPVDIKIIVLCPDLTKEIYVSFDSTIPDTIVYCKTGLNEIYDTISITRTFTVPGTKKIKVDIQLTNGTIKPFHYSFDVNEKKLSVTFDSVSFDHRIEPDKPDTMIFCAVTDPSGGGIEFSVQSKPALDSTGLKVIDLGSKAMVITTAPMDTVYVISVSAQSGTASDIVTVKLTSHSKPSLYEKSAKITFKTEISDTLCFYLHTSPSDTVKTIKLLNLSSFSKGEIFPITSAQDSLCFVFTPDSMRTDTFYIEATTNYSKDTLSYIVTIEKSAFRPWKEDNVKISGKEGETLKLSLIPYLIDTTLTNIQLTTNKGDIAGKFINYTIPYGRCTEDSIIIKAVKGSDSSNLKFYLNVAALDTIKPVIMLVNPDENEKTVFSDSITVQIICMDSSGIESVGCIHAGKSVDAINNGSDSLYYATITDLTPGTDTITITATDKSINANKKTFILTLKFTRFKVIYSKNGNATGTVPLDTNSYVKGSKAVVIGNVGSLVNDGYVFSGWNTKSDGTGITYAGGDFILTDTSDITLYAKWTPVVLKITKNPGDFIAEAGDTVIFSVAANDVAGATLLYQWQKNNRDIPGAQNDSLKLCGVTKSDSGSIYRCIISTNAGGNAASNSGRLKVTSIKAVWASLYHTMILKTDGTLWATGRNSDGQLGDGNTIDRSTPKEIMKDVKNASSCGIHTMIVKNDGTLWATGSNSSGQLGNGDTINVFTPVQIMSDVSDVSAGGYHTMILKKDGSLWATGRNTDGQLGNGNTINISTPVQVMSDVKAVCAGGIQTMILKTDGTLWTTGNNEYGQLGDSTNSSRSTPKKIMSDVKAVSNKGAHTMILKTDGTLWATGYNYTGGLGDGSTNSINIPKQIMSEIVAVWAGSSYTMILKTDKTLWGTGSNANGQLGDGTNTDKLTPVKIMSDVESASPSRTSTLIIKTDGTLWAAGDNKYGQLGDGTTQTTRTSPILIRCR